MGSGLSALPDCIPCSLGRVLSAVRRVSRDEWVHEKILKRVMAAMAHTDLARSPAEVSFEALQIASKLLGRQDVFAEDRRRCVARAKALLPDLRRRVAESPDPLLSAARLAIAGDVVDSGPSRASGSNDVQSDSGVLSNVDAMADIERALETGLAVDESTAFREAVRSAKTVFYILDGAGEAVLDGLLVEQLRRRTVTCLARSSPVLNCATVEDARDAGLGLHAEIVSPAQACLGFVANLVDPAIRERFKTADVVIAKGQAGFETLAHADREVFFLLRAGCPIVARALGVGEGDAALARRIAPDERRALKGPARCDPSLTEDVVEDRGRPG